MILLDSYVLHNMGLQYPSSAALVANRDTQTIDIGGKYAPLVNQFILTEAVLATDRKSVMTVGYLVTDK